jgi:diacylglycerol kinase (ATP)
VKPLLIVNPRAAGSRTGASFSAAAAAVRETLGPVDAAFTEYSGHGVQLARLAAEGGRELIVAVGGDGTLSEVVNGVLQSGLEPRVGFIAAGTGGDFRRSVGVGPSVEECLRAIASGRERRIDVGRLTYRDTGDGAMKERYFLNIVSAGMGGLVDRYVENTPAWVGGRLGYYAATLRAIYRCPESWLHCVVTTDGRHEERMLLARVLAVCNGAYFGSGMHMAPMAQVDDGVLEVVSVTQPTRLHMLVRSRSIYDASHFRFAGVEHLRCQRIEIDLEDEAARPLFLLDVDGEALGGLPMSAEVVPAALVLRV